MTNIIQIHSNRSLSSPSIANWWKGGVRLSLRRRRRRKAYKTDSNLERVTMITTGIYDVEGLLNTKK
jgi:hypothetical protein